jgi:hypothetical protein
MLKGFSFYIKSLQIFIKPRGCDKITSAVHVVVFCFNELFLTHSVNPDGYQVVNLQFLTNQERKMLVRIVDSYIACCITISTSITPKVAIKAEIEYQLMSLLAM